MRRASWRSVPRMCNPPISATCRPCSFIFSLASISATSAFHSSSGTSRRVAYLSLRRAQAIVSGLPPRMMSVPRPAMLVESVTAPMRPAWATISASRAANSGLALSSSCLMPRRLSMALNFSDVDKSEKLSAMLKRRGIKHELLNAKPEFAAREAEIVAQAGRIGAVTISTNMAGRGTDIILGGNPEFLAWARLKETYPTRLDVPPDIWKKTVDEIRVKEMMEEEGRQVADM